MLFLPFPLPLAPSLSCAKTLSFFLSFLTRRAPRAGARNFLPLCPSPLVEPSQTSRDAQQPARTSRVHTDTHADLCMHMLGVLETSAICSRASRARRRRHACASSCMSSFFRPRFLGPAVTSVRHVSRGRERERRRQS